MGTRFRPGTGVSCLCCLLQCNLFSGYDGSVFGSPSINSFKLTVAGFVNGAGTCEALNGVWTLMNTGTVCYWTTDLFGGVGFWNLTLSPNMDGTWHFLLEGYSDGGATFLCASYSADLCHFRDIPVNLGNLVQNTTYCPTPICATLPATVLLERM